MHMTVARQCGKSELCRLIAHNFLFNYDKRKYPQAIICAQSFASVNRLYFGPLYKQLQSLESSGLVNLEYNKQKEVAKIVLQRPWLGDECTIHFGSASSESVGNRFRGLTIDLIILDEYSFYGSDIWNSIFSPFLDNTDGKAILTSTVNGPNFYHTVGNMFADQFLDGNPKYGWMDLDIHKAKVYSDQWVKDRKNDFISEPWRWRMEYLNDVYAGATSEYPLGELFSQREDLIVQCPDHTPNDHGIVVSVDLGASGNMATWCVMRGPQERKITVVKYEDKYNGIAELLDDVWNTFKDYREIQVVWPHDAQHPSITLGGTQRDYILKTTHERRYNRMTHNFLDKTQNKLSIWRETIRDSSEFVFASFVNVQKGLKKLKSFKFHKDPKTKIVEFGKVTKNGAQHAADSFAYLCQSLYLVSTVTSRDGYSQNLLRQIEASTQHEDYRNRENTTYYKK